MTFCFPGYPYQQPPQYVPRDYIRNPPPHSESGPPYPDPYPGYGPPERTYPAPHSGQQFSYPHPSHYDRGRHMSYSGPPPPPQPYPSQREGLVRMSPAPLDVPPPSTGHSNSVYHPEPSSRDRYAADGYYPPGAQPMNMRPYVRVSMALDMLCSHFSWCGYWGGGRKLSAVQQSLFVCASHRGHHVVVLKPAWTICIDAGRSCYPSWRKGRSFRLHLLLLHPLLHIPSPTTILLMLVPRKFNIHLLFMSAIVIFSLLFQA